MAHDKEPRIVDVRTRAAEQLALESERRFELVVDGVTDYAIFMLDPGGHVTTWNTGAERLKGYSAEEIVGQHFSIFYPPEALAIGWPEHELEVAKRDGRFEDEGWRVRKDGSQFWANVVITAVHDRDGALTGFLKITRDLTERKRQEEDLRQSEERFRLLVEGVMDYAIFMLDPDGRITSWNEGARRIKGYSADEIVGRHFSTFYPPEALAIGWPEHELEVAKRDGRFEDEGWRVRKDGSQFWANVVITALRGSDGRLRGFAKVTRDLTERRRVQSLEEANQRMNEFLATVSHELRTPLNSMLGWIRILQSRPIQDPTLARGLATISRNTIAQAQLVEDLLDVSRIVSGKLRLVAEPVDVEHVVRAAVDSLRLAVEAKSIRIQILVEPPIGIIRGDPERLQQVLWNLLSNAIKFTPKGGRILLSLVREDDHVVIGVEDTGEGIAPEFLPHVFEQFRQADASSTREHGGLGLGLSIVKHLVEAHGGTVRAASEGKGRGATFVVRLPLATTSSEATTAHVVEALSEADVAVYPRILAGARVLVVEDESDTREMLALILAECDAEVRAVASSAEGLEVFDEWRPDVIVSDIEMPGGDGYEFMRKVRARPADRGGSTPAAALTAYARVESRLRALQAGFQVHVAKPVEPADLVRVVHSLLQYRNAGPEDDEPFEQQ